LQTKASPFEQAYAAADAAIRRVASLKSGHSECCLFLNKPMLLFLVLPPCTVGIANAACSSIILSTVLMTVWVSISFFIKGYHCSARQGAAYTHRPRVGFLTEQIQLSPLNLFCCAFF
jgi:hypothetical protein